MRWSLSGPETAGGLHLPASRSTFSDEGDGATVDLIRKSRPRRRGHARGRVLPGQFSPCGAPRAQRWPTTVEAVNDTLIRWGGSRAVVSLSLKIIVILLLVGGVPLLAFWPFGKTHAPTVEVYDEANVLQDDGTAFSLENLCFRKDVKLIA